MLDTRAIFPLTRRQAAWRGAKAGMLWATAWTVLVTAVVAAWGGRAAAPPVFRESASFFSVRPSELGAWAATVLAGAAIAGAPIGLLGRKIRARPWVRSVWLWLAFFPAAGLAGAFTLGLVAAGVSLAAGEPRPFELLAGLPFLALLGTIVMAPVLAIPLLLAGVTVERWTRPGTTG